MPASAPFASNVYYDSSSDAHFRLWGSTLSAALASLGFVQTADSIVLTLTSVATGTGVYTGTVTGGGSNAFAGLTFVIAGFTTGANNGTFLCTASSVTTLTLVNASSVSETHAATATSAQVNWTTVTHPTAISSYTGYELWKANDSLQSTCPIYFKIEYGSSVTSSTQTFSLTSVAAGTGVYTGTITGGGSSNYAGMTFVITGFVNGANNGTFSCTASTTTTLTLVNASSISETHAGTAAVSANGTTSTTFAPGVRWTFGTGSDGAGNLTGNVTSSMVVGSNGSSPIVHTAYECDFSGCGQYNGSAMGIVMFRLDTTGAQPANNTTWGLFLERSLNASGSYTGEYYTYWLTWGSSGGSPGTQQSVYAPGTGTPALGIAINQSTYSVCNPYTTGTNTNKQNGTFVAMLPIFPMVGVLGNPMTCVQFCMRGDVTEPTIGPTGGQITCGTPYGGSHTYLTCTASSASGGNWNINVSDAQGYAVCVRWE